MKERTGPTSAPAGGPSHRTTVALIEDQQALASAIQRSLATIEDLECVGAAATLADGIELVASLRPDVLVTDYRLTDGDVPSVLTHLLERSPSTRVLVFTGWPDDRSYHEAMAEGASGFLDKAAPFEEFVDAIRRVDRGELVVSRRLLPG